MQDELAAAWSDLHDVAPSGWFVGRPSYHDARRQWMLYAFDPAEKAVVGVRQREWEAVADSDLGVVRGDGGAARLRLLGSGPWQPAARE